VLALLVLTAFTLITVDYRANGGGSTGSARRGATGFFGPIERLAADAVRPIRNAASAIGSVGSNHKKLQDLEKRNSALQTQLREEPFNQTRVDELNTLLHVSAVGQYKLVPAQVIGTGSGLGFEWTATIDAGSIDGIKANMTVLNGDGLVGRVKTVSSQTSVIVLANDPEFNVGVRLADGYTGIVSGHGRADMSLTLLDPSARVKVGDGLVTQGSQNQLPFVWGVPVGQVVTASSVLSGETQTGTVHPFVNFTDLDLVGVVVEPPRTDPRQALLQPPVPTVTATATVTVTATPPPVSSNAPVSSSVPPSHSSSPKASVTPSKTPKPSVTPTPLPHPSLTPKPSVTPKPSLTPKPSITPTGRATTPATAAANSAAVASG
jgi:rod shape-determining protein MreC